MAKGGGNHIEKAIYFNRDKFLRHHIEIKNVTGIDYNLLKDKWGVLRLYTFTC